MSDSEGEYEDFKSGEHVEVEIDEDRDLRDEYRTFQEFEDDFKRWQREIYQTFTIAKSDKLPAGHALKDDIVYQDIKADDDTVGDDKADADADSVFSDVVSDVDVAKAEELIPTKAKLVVVGKSKAVQMKTAVCHKYASIIHKRLIIPRELKDHARDNPE